MILPILSFMLFLFSNGIVSAESISYMSTVPPEIQKVWEERMGAVSTGDMKAGEAMLDTIVKMKYTLGINRMDGKLAGDVDFASVKEKAAYITPVPGGVGPMTVAMLIENTLDLFKKKVNQKMENMRK